MVLQSSQTVNGKKWLDIEHIPSQQHNYFTMSDWPLKENSLKFNPCDGNATQKKTIHIAELQENCGCNSFPFHSATRFLKNYKWNGSQNITYWVLVI